MRHLRLVAGLMAAVVIVGCGASGTGASAGVSSGDSRSCTNPNRAVRFATVAPGAPNASDAQFLSDQNGLFDPAQFGDPTYYIAGYHWKVDRAFSPQDVASIESQPSGGGGLLLTLFFNAQGAARLRVELEQAAAAQPQSPMNHLAVFVGKEVLATPIITGMPRITSSIQIALDANGLPPGYSSLNQLLYDMCG